MSGRTCKRNFDDGQIVELAAVIGLFNYFNRFNDALRVEITKPGMPATEEPSTGERVATP